MGRYINKREDYYSPDWTKLKVRGKVKISKEVMAKPVFWEKLLELAEKLANGFEYIRVDFNVVDDKLYFSELTFTPANGNDRFRPIEKDLELANLIDLKKYNKPINQ